MEHFPPFTIEPALQAIENLIAFPTALLTDSNEKKQTKRQILHSRLDLQEKEAELEKLQSTLIAKSAELQEKEKQLSERWDAGRIYTIPISEITANPYQPRREFDDITLFSLANSIREHGILQPLTVRRIQQDSASVPLETGDMPHQETKHTYQLIAGERRLRAASAIGMECVPCIILDADNRRAAELALIENLQRENLNIFEQAGAIAALIDIHAMTQEEIAKTLAVSQSCVANKLRLLRLTTEERNTILSCHLSERHARAFLKIKDLELRRKTVQFVADHGYNVAQTEEHIDSLLNDTPSIHVSPQSTELHSSSNPTPQRKNQKCIIKDLRLFYNTIEKALSIVREAGFFADSKRAEQEDGIVLTVMIRYPIQTANQTKEIKDRFPDIVSRETENTSEITNIR